MYVFALVVADKKAPALRCTASHAAAQLVQGAQTVALCVFDHHYAGIGHIHTHLNDGGGHQCVQPSGFEVLHHGSFLLGFELAVHQAYPALRQQGFGNVLVVALNGVQPAIRCVLDGGADQIHLPPSTNLLIEKMVEVAPLFAGDAAGLDRCAARRQLVQNGDVQIAVDEQAQRAGNGRCTHHQQVRIRGLFGQHSALPYPKAVLLVDHGKTKPGKLYAFAEDGVGAHHKVGFVVPDGGKGGAACSGLHAAGQQGHPHPEGGKHPVQAFGVLGGQNFCRGQQRGLIPRSDAGPDGGSRHQRFAAAHIALQKAVHGSLARHVGQNLAHGPALGSGGGKGQAGPERGRVGKLHGRTGGSGTPVFHPANAQLQNQKFFIDQPPPGCIGLLFGGRAVDGPHSICLGEQTVFCQHFRRKRVGQKLCMGQQLPHALGDGIAGQALGLGVDRFKGRSLDLLGGAHLRVDHLAAQHPAGNDALKIIFLSQLQLLGGIGIIEPCDLQTGHIVPGSDALHPPPARQDTPAGFGEHLSPDDALHIGGRFGDGIGFGEVDISARVVAQQVGQRHDAQLLEPLGGLGADALQVAHRRIRGEGGMVFGGHGVSSFL